MVAAEYAATDSRVVGKGVLGTKRLVVGRVARCVGGWDGRGKGGGKTIRVIMTP